MGVANRDVHRAGVAGQAQGPRPRPARGKRGKRSGRGVVIAVWVLGLVPLTGLLLNFFAGELGANPIQALTHETGRWTVRLLLASLAVTPLRRVTGYGKLIRLRKPLGLLAFTYASVHLSVFFLFDHALDPASIAADVAKRPWVTVGFAAWIILVPLAITSTKGWIRRLGKAWQRLHRLVYAAGVLAILHWLWVVKADTRDPLIYGSILAVLLGFRVADAVRRRIAPARARRGRGAGASGPGPRAAA